MARSTPALRRGGFDASVISDRDGCRLAHLYGTAQTFDPIKAQAPEA
jgi:hypothetical protein